MRIKPVPGVIDVANGHHRAVARSAGAPDGHPRQARLGWGLSDRRPSEERGHQAAEQSAAEEPAAAQIGPRTEFHGQALS